MYTIKQAADRSGVAVPTIRAWERRYGVVRPGRTPSGYRLYDDEAIERLGAMRRLVEGGWRPSLAAIEIGERGPAAAAAIGGAAAREAVGGPGSEAAAAESAVGVIRRFVDAAAAMDEAALGRVLDDVFASSSFERASRGQLFPALRALGEAWAAGVVAVSGEHLASHAVLRRLALAFEAAGRAAPASVDHVVVGLPPGSHHELGALAFAVALRRAGTPVTYLGPDLPVEDWARAATGAAAAVIGVVTPRDRRAAREVATRLLHEASAEVVAAGGDAADGLQVPGVMILPGDIETAVAGLVDVLAASRH